MLESFHCDFSGIVTIEAAAVSDSYVVGGEPYSSRGDSDERFAPFQYESMDCYVTATSSSPVNVLAPDLGLLMLVQIAIAGAMLVGMFFNAGRKTRN